MGISLTSFRIAGRCLARRGAAALVVALAASPAFGQSEAPALGISAPLSGDSASLGAQVRAGAEAAAGGRSEPRSG